MTQFNEWVKAAAFGCVMLALLVGCTADPTKGADQAVVKDAVETQGENADSTEPAIPDGKKYVFDKDASNIEFQSSKKIGGEHAGGWTEYTGSVIVPEGDFTKGYISVEFDMNSLVSDDDDLTITLKGEQFFEVDKFPTASFVTTGIETADSDDEFTVSGNLTMHGITKNITCPALVELSDDQVIAEAEFSIRRKDWGIDFDGAVDNVIREKVLLVFYVEANVE
jgi:polyisoprenoid-binding protein YceI